MIKLLVDEYCHGCPQFSAETLHALTAVFEDGEEFVIKDPTIICKHRLLCRQIHKYLAKKYEEQNKNEDE